MIIKSHKKIKTSAASVAPKQPEPQLKVEKSPERREENKKISSRRKEVKQSPIFEDLFQEEEIIVSEEEK